MTNHNQAVEGCCFSCRHMAEIRLDGYIRCICVQERDEHDKNETGYFGEIFECDLDSTECKDWKWDGCSTASDRP